MDDIREIPLFKVFNSLDIESAAIDVMRSGKIAGGSYVQSFEKGLSKVLGYDHIVTVSDMTSAIFMVLHMLGIKKGDDVITTSFSCMATNAPIAAIGANAIWVDVMKNSVYIDPIAFEQSITPNTKAAILYHVSGYPGPVKEISAICKKHGITLLEDCNNAMMATVGDQFVGGYGDFGILSFYPTRLLQTFEGAAVICRSKILAEKLRKFRRLGIDFSTFRNSDGEISQDSDIPDAGWASSLSNLSAAVGYAQLDGMQERIASVRSRVSMLSEALNEIEGVELIEPFPDSNPSNWTLLILVEKRDQLLRFLKEKGIHVSALHQMNHIYSCFQQSKDVNLPNTEFIQQHILAIPCGWWLSQEDIEYVIAMMRMGIHQIYS